MTKEQRDRVLRPASEGWSEAEWWNAQLTEARKLPDAELARHASVSTDNRHECRSCFTCACEAVRRERGM